LNEFNGENASHHAGQSLRIGVTCRVPGNLLDLDQLLIKQTFRGEQTSRSRRYLLFGVGTAKIDTG
jgi:hypothetical protein